MSPFRTLLAMFLVMLSWTGNTSAATIYKWVDSHGVTQYSEQPPPGINSTQIATPPPITAASQQQAVAEAKSLIEETNRRATERTLNQANQGRDSASARRSMASHIEFCSKTRGDLSWLQEPLPFYRNNDRGERVYIDDGDRPAEIQRLQEVVRTQCNDEATSEAAAQRRSESKQRPECLASMNKLRSLAVPGTHASSQDMEQARQSARHWCVDNP